jgi:tRNA(Ile)-lysidine synthetase-like protein
VTTFVTEVDSALSTAGVAPGSALLCAISGGPDSTALLRALTALREARTFSLHACIVDHGIRPPAETDADVDFARRLCAAFEVPLAIARIRAGDCASRARESGRGLEETARDLRHQSLREAAAGAGASAVVLGHTMDDSMETLLMRVLQGSGVDGLRGIPLRRGDFVHPMVSLGRTQVIDYLRSIGQDWREDLTNHDTAILRNRIRHRLVPVLSKEFPGYRSGLLAMAAKLSDVHDFVQSKAAELAWKRHGAGFSIDLQEFLAAEAALRAASLLSLYDRIRPKSSPRRLPWRFINPAVRMPPLGPPEALVPRSRSWILKGYGVGLSIVGKRLFWEPDIASQGKKGYFIEVREAGTVAIRGTALRLSLSRSAGMTRAEAGGIAILGSEVRPPLVLRSKRKGDVILLENGETSVKDLLAGWKVPREHRESFPLLADRSGVLAVLGSALGYRTRARAGALAGDLGDADRIIVRAYKDMEQ